MKIELSQEQVDYIFKLLDLQLKTQGLNGLIKAVDLYNALASAIERSDVSEENK